MKKNNVQILQKMFRKMVRLANEINSQKIGYGRQLLIKKYRSLKNRMRRKQMSLGLGSMGLMFLLSGTIQSQEILDLSNGIDPSIGHELAYGSNGLLMLESGDFNGDGLDDFVVGEHIIWGTGTAPELNVQNLASEDYTTILFDDGQNVLGANIRFIDYNIDGITDIASFKYNSILNRGEIQILFGGSYLSLLNNLNLADNDHPKIQVFKDITIVDVSYHMAVLGDLNGDGGEEISFSGMGGGLLFSNQITLDGEYDYGDLTTDQSFNLTGYKEGNSGDINGDGFQDVYLSSGYNPTSGTIVFGQAGNFGTQIPTNELSGISINTSETSDMDAQVSIVNDMNGDGFDELMIKLYDYYGYTPENDKVYIMNGRANWAPEINFTTIEEDADLVVSTLPSSTDQFWSLGDFNGDGMNDVIDHNFENGDDKIILGNCTGYTNVQEYADFDISNSVTVHHDTKTIYEVRKGPDFNQDGIRDFVLRAGLGNDAEYYAVYGVTPVEAECDFATLIVKVADENGLFGIGNLELQVNGLGSFYTDEFGLATIRIPSSGNYVVTPLGLPQHLTLSSSSMTYPMNTANEVVESLYPYTINQTVNDLEAVITHYTASRPGFPFRCAIDISNKGTQLTTGDVQIIMPEELNFESSSLPGTLSNNSLSINVPNLDPQSTQRIWIDGTYDTDTPLGDTMVYSVVVNTINADDMPLNNSDNLNLIVTGSYDPNDKTAQPTMTPEAVVMAEELEYLIRFQNTGTDTAFTIVVEDILSENLMWDSFRPIATSHSASAVRADNLIRYNFNNILLVDSLTNEPDSHGFIHFAIKPQPSLIEGDHIENTAAIFFDFNEPIITNTVVTEIQDDVVISSLDEKPSKTHLNFIYPNPTSGIVYFSNEENAIFTLINMYGSTVLTGQINNGQLDLSEVVPGFYVIKVENNQYKIILE